MTQLSVFSQLVAGMIATARKTVDEKWAWIDFQALVDFFTSITDETVVRTLEFSDKVKDLISNAYFSLGGEEHKLLQVLIDIRPELLHHSALEALLKATNDEKIAKMYLNRFFYLEPDFDTEFGANDDIVWRAKSALSVIVVMAPDQKSAFAKTALGMFPNLPMGPNGEGGFRGLLEILAGQELAMAPVATTQPTLLRKEEVPVSAHNGNNKRAQTRSDEPKVRQDDKSRRSAGIPKIGEEKYYHPPANLDTKLIAEGQLAIQKDRKAEEQTFERAKAPAPAFAGLAGLRASLPKGPTNGHSAEVPATIQ